MPLPAPEEPRPTAGAPPSRLVLRILPVLLIALAAGAIFATGAHRFLSLATLREHYAALEVFVARNVALALTLYMLAYVVVTALSIPGATLMSVLGGFLFGNLMGTGAVVVSATIGATIIFMAARTAFGDIFRKRAAGFFQKMEAGFNENAFSYLLLLRLIPLFPFFIVNIVPAFTRIRPGTFILATLIGVIPGAFAFVSAGNGLGAVLARDEGLELSGLLLRPEILTPIIALSVLAILPIVYKVARRPHKSEPRS